MPSEPAVRAAGGIVWRKADRPSGIEVLLIRRVRYDDWSFPKGKIDPGEHLSQTAVREVREETGYRIRLGHPLPPTRYRVAQGRKEVTWWIARPLKGQRDLVFTPNDEVDEIRWVDARHTDTLLNYAHDRLLMEAFIKLARRGAHRSRTLVIARHATAMDRSGWSEDDLDRPLVRRGVDEAEQLAARVAPYGVGRVVSSPALRCLQTVEPYVHRYGPAIQQDARLAEGTDSDGVRDALGAVMNRKRPAMICSHRPILPHLFAELHLRDPRLSPGAAMVVHHRDGQVLTTEIIVPQGR